MQRKIKPFIVELAYKKIEHKKPEYYFEFVKNITKELNIRFPQQELIINGVQGIGTFIKLYGECPYEYDKTSLEQILKQKLEQHKQFPNTKNVNYQFFKILSFNEETLSQDLQKFLEEISVQSEFYKKNTSSNQSRVNLENQTKQMTGNQPETQVSKSNQLNTESNNIPQNQNSRLEQIAETIQSGNISTSHLQEDQKIQDLSTNNYDIQEKNSEESKQNEEDNILNDNSKIQQNEDQDQDDQGLQSLNDLSKDIKDLDLKSKEELIDFVKDFQSKIKDLKKNYIIIKK